MSDLNPPMTLEEARNFSKWRPGVHYGTQADERMRLMDQTLTERDDEILRLKKKCNDYAKRLSAAGQKDICYEQVLAPASRPTEQQGVRP